MIIKINDNGKKVSRNQNTEETNYYFSLRHWLSSVILMCKKWKRKDKEGKISSSLEEENRNQSVVVTAAISTIISD